MDNDHSRHDLETQEAILKNVEQYGCHLALVEADDYFPGFAYTIGLYKRFGHPEILCFSLAPNVMGAVLNHARDLAKQGKNLVPGESYDDFLDGYAVQFVAVDKSYYPDYMGYGCWYYGNTFDFPLLQLVWPDKEHRFPWADGFNPAWKFKQPLLDRNTDFKFREERNLCVYTTRQAFEGKPILYVYHHADGAGQFHTGPEPEVADGMLVGLEEITKLDPTVNGAAQLGYGRRAVRENKGARWVFEDWEGDENP
jgi:hypothetical protein